MIRTHGGNIVRMDCPTFSCGNEMSILDTPIEFAEAARISINLSLMGLNGLSKSNTDGVHRAPSSRACFIAEIESAHAPKSSWPCRNLCSAIVANLANVFLFCLIAARSRAKVLSGTIEFIRSRIVFLAAEITYGVHCYIIAVKGLGG